MGQELINLDFKNIVSELWERNQDNIEKFAKNMGIVEVLPTLETVVVDVMEYANNYDKVVINLIGADQRMANFLLERFKNDERIVFFIDATQPTDHLSNVKATIRPLEGSNGDLLDYTSPLILSDSEAWERVYLIDGGKSGELDVERNEKRLCKLAAEAIKKNRKIGVSTYDKDSLVYIKGLLKGAAAANTKVEFLIDVQRQKGTLGKMRSELYAVVPMVSLDKKRSLYELKKKILSGMSNVTLS